MMTAEQLRYSLLDLAFKGKLTTRENTDGNGEKLLNHIICSSEEHTYNSNNHDPIELSLTEDLPNNWTIVKLGFLGKLYSGYAFKSSQYVDSGIQVVRISDLDDDSISIKDAVFYQESNELEKYKIIKGSFLICMTGSIGKMARVLDDIPRYLNQRVGMFVPTQYCNSDYIWYFLHTYDVINEWISAKTSTNGNIKNANIVDLLCPLPPLEEQNRIVTKIEELMPFVEQYAAASTKLNNLNATFPDMMKKSILQEAVQGKLVPHDPSDEPAGELLKKIAEEKQRLIKKGKIKKQKALPEITEDEIPFDIPDSWEWVRLDELASFENGDRGKNYPNKSEYVDKGVAWINTGHIEPTGYLTQINMNFITREKYDSLRSGKIEPHDLVFCLRGATYGKVALVKPYTEGAIASSLMIIRPIISSLADYLYLYLRSPLAFNELQKYANGSAQPNLGAKDVRKYLVPIPPLEEQRRIVGRIEELLPYIEELA